MEKKCIMKIIYLSYKHKLNINSGNINIIYNNKLNVLKFYFFNVKYFKIINKNQKNEKNRRF